MRKLRPIATLVAALALLGVVGPEAASGGDEKDLVIGLHIVKQGKQVLALVPVTINGEGPFTFALDTGASRSLIDSAVARRLQVPKKGSAGKIAGVNAVKKASLVRVKSWRVGQVKLPPTTIISTNLPYGNAYAGIQGLLGSDMLSRFDVVTIDYGKQQLRLHPRTP
jgi:predicted aspartyl protease